MPVFVQQCGIFPFPLFFFLFSPVPRGAQTATSKTPPVAVDGGELVRPNGICGSAAALLAPASVADAKNEDSYYLG